MTPEEIRAHVEAEAANHLWDADKKETYRQQLQRIEERKADALAAAATPVRPLSTRAELAAAGYGMEPAPTWATHAWNRALDGPVPPPEVARRMAEQRAEAEARQAEAMARMRPLRRPDGTVMAGVFELDYDKLNGDKLTGRTLYEHGNGIA